MAAPNVAGTATEVYLRSLSLPIGTAAGTSATLILSNGSASSTVLELTSLTVNNVDGASACDVSVLRVAGTNSTQLFTTISVPADASLRVVDTQAKVIVPEGQEIRVFASAAGDLTFDAGWTEYK